MTPRPVTLRSREKKGILRRAYLSPADGSPAEFGLYIPARYDPAKKWPLIVALHGMDGLPLAMMRWFFGFDEVGKDQIWEDRHPVEPSALPPLDAIVVTPNGHGNTMYRELGEDDVMRVVAWARAHYSVDDTRITVTGPSMGGIGAGAVGLHHPDVFAAAEPLCGYHSYFVRRDISSRPRRPWEQLVAEERSNSYWAQNGRFLPLFIVHGQRDLPPENSGVLIDKYRDLHFDVTDEHPDLGHNVWQSTYENLRGAKWLLGKRKTFSDVHLEFKTTGPRVGDDAWAHLDAVTSQLAWTHIDARKTGSAVVVTTENARALHFDPAGVTASESAGAARDIVVDGTPLSFAAGEIQAAHREESGWKKGPLLDLDHTKHGHVTGPLRDVFHEAIVFVYGAQSSTGAVANETVARAFARIRPGIDVHYPVMSDVEFLARGEKLDVPRALFLVGSAKENALVRELEKDFPIRVDGAQVIVGDHAFVGEELGTAFIRPNPAHPSSYVVVIEAPTPVGTMRALSLPDILPDFVVYDRGVAPSRNQLILGAGALRAGGMFRSDWTLPTVIDDPLAATARPRPKNEHDATPYLP